MGITWDKKAIERIIGALLVAHPGFTPDYKTMAVYFGQGATYDSMQGRFREYRRIAESMRQENPGSKTPLRRTPGSGRVSKSTSSAKHNQMQTPITPSKSGKGKRGYGISDAILIEEESDCFIKTDNGLSLFEKAAANSTANLGMKSENRFTDTNSPRDDYSTANEFLSGLENAEAHTADGFQVAAFYNKDVGGYVEYDDAV
ncbi:hypothetical protein PABG_07356 [Paracoccidioides brasiliensis Pb03]|nr:hypothetical protein PABG_07356 [Paracoccidioides brasiliensis Pb03]